MRPSRGGRLFPLRSWLQSPKRTKEFCLCTPSIWHSWRLYNNNKVSACYTNSLNLKNNNDIHTNISAYKSACTSQRWSKNNSCPNYIQEIIPKLPIEVMLSSLPISHLILRQGSRVSTHSSFLQWHRHPLSKLLSPSRLFILQNSPDTPTHHHSIHLSEETLMDTDPTSSDHIYIRSLLSTQKEPIHKIQQDQRNADNNPSPQTTTPSGKRSFRTASAKRFTPPQYSYTRSPSSSSSYSSSSPSSSSSATTPNVRRALLKRTRNTTTSSDGPSPTKKAATTK